MAAGHAPLPVVCCVFHPALRASGPVLQVGGCLRFNGQLSESPDHFHGGNDFFMRQMAAGHAPLPVVCCVSHLALRASPGISIARSHVRGAQVRVNALIPGEARRAV